MLKKKLARFAANDDGATAIEYAMIASVVALGIFASLQTLPPALSAVFASVVAILGN